MQEEHSLTCTVEFVLLLHLGVTGQIQFCMKDKYYPSFFYHLSFQGSWRGLEPISASSGEGGVTLDMSPVHCRADI